MLLRTLRDFVKLKIAARNLGRASKLRSEGHDDAATAAYRDVIGRLDDVGTLPTDFARFTIRDVAHASIRLTAYGDLAALLAQRGEAAQARDYARGVLEICRRVPRNADDKTDLFVKWEAWASAFIAEDEA